VSVREWAAGRTGISADAGLAAVFAVLLATWAFQISWARGTGQWQFGCAAGAAVCATALMRRRHRRWAAVAGLAVATATILISRLTHLPSEPGPAMALALSVLVGSAVRALPALRACAIATGGFAVVFISGFAALSSGVPAVMVLNGTGWLAALAMGLNLRLFDGRRRAIAEIVRRDERLDLARELHDVVAHHITGIVVQAQAAQLVARKQPEKLEGSLAGIEAAGSDALSAMRRVVGLLRDADDAAPATSGPERLSELVERFRGHGPAVRLRLPDDEDESVWPPEVTSTVYRVVQESLTNVSRHAPHARSVTVSVARDREALTVEVADDAAPVPARSHHRVGYGLVGMRERLEALGGTLCAGPRPEAGWSVLATLPVSARGRR
jgi:signal transduction histidine kinase